MIADQKTEPIDTATNRKTDRPTTDRIHRIACTFPALIRKGVASGNIPGINPDGFCAEQLHEFLQRKCCVWSSGEVLLLEFLLNLYDPDEYKSFNFGRALNVLDPGHMSACLKAAVQYYNGE
jgi:hypothetical protein